MGVWDMSRKLVAVHFIEIGIYYCELSAIHTVYMHEI